MRIRFISGNKFKIEEAMRILPRHGIEVVPVALKLEELQGFDVGRIVEDKALKAYEKVGWPLFVEHTVLELDALNGFPGGLTEVFWETMKSDGLCSLLNKIGDHRVTATTHVAYCDGRSIHQLSGSVRGTIAAAPRAEERFQWDCVFIPDGSDQTFAEMGDKKHDLSMRARAFERLASHLKDTK